MEGAVLPWFRSTIRGERPGRPGVRSASALVLLLAIGLLLQGSVPGVDTIGRPNGIDPGHPIHSPETSRVTAASDWTDLTSNYPNPPSKRAYGGMAFDTAAGAYILFGGENGGAVLGDTWNFTVAHGWNELSSSSSVAARADPAFAYDSSSSEIVLFGGCEGLSNCPAGDTWLYSGGAWTQDTTGTAPAAMLSATMADDPAVSGTVMFGGCTSFSVLSSTCNTFVATTYIFTATAGWKQIAPTSSPSARSSPCMAYDPADGYLLLFGGYSGSVGFGDTWTFKNDQWTNITSTLSVSPGPRSSCVMFWDPTLGQVVMFGGSGSSSSDLGDTWAYVGGRWTELAASGGPSPREGAMWGAPSSGAPILFAGQSNGTYDTDTWSFSVPLTVTAAITPGSVDVNQSVSFSATAAGGQGPYSYAWSFGDGQQSAVGNTSHTYTAPSAPTYTAVVTVKDGAGGTATRSFTVTVAPDPQVSAAASPTTALEGKNISFSASPTGGTGPFQYLWTFGDGTNATLQDPSHAYKGAGNYSSRVVLTDSTGVTASATVNVSITAPPGALTVSFTATPTSGTAPLTVHFTPHVTGGKTPYAYRWTFGNGTASSTVTNPVYTYGASGVFPAELNVTDGSGNSSTYSQSISVSAPAFSALVSATPTSGPAPLTVSFVSTILGGAAPFTYAWNFGDTHVATTADPTHTFNSSGSYNVTLRVTDAPSAGQVADAWVLVNVTAIAPLQVTVQPGGCVSAGSAMTFSASVNGGTSPYAYNWSFGDGTPVVSTSASSVTHTYNLSGSYALSVRVTDAAQRSTVTNLSVTVVGAGQCTSSGHPGTAGSAGFTPMTWLALFAPIALLTAITLLTFAGFRGRSPTQRTVPPPEA